MTEQEARDEREAAWIVWKDGCVTRPPKQSFMAGWDAALATGGSRLEYRHAWHIFEAERPRIERSQDLNVILKRLGVEDPTYEDLAAVTRWADAHVQAGLEALVEAGALAPAPEPEEGDEP